VCAAIAAHRSQLHLSSRTTLVCAAIAAHHSKCSWGAKAHAPMATSPTSQPFFHQWTRTSFKKGFTRSVLHRHLGFSSHVSAALSKGGGSQKTEHWSPGTAKWITHHQNLEVHCFVPASTRFHAKGRPLSVMRRSGRGGLGARACSPATLPSLLLRPRSREMTMPLVRVIMRQTHNVLISMRYLAH
jgi:hypothetical protein